MLGVIDEVAAAEKLSDINSLKKLKNHKTAIESGLKIIG
jgi:hypothetical protein